MQRSPRTWIGALLRLALVLTGASIVAGLSGCDQSGAATPAASAASAASPATVASAVAEQVPMPAAGPLGATESQARRGLPAITFDRLVHDFGQIVDTEPATTSFRFTNTGTGTLVIKEVKSSCGCTVPQLSRYEFAPGEGDAINITFDPFARKDEAAKTITVISNAEPPLLDLTIKADVRPLVRIVEKFIRFGVIELGHSARKLVTIQYSDPGLAVREVSVNHPSITAEVVESGVPIAGENGRVLYEARIAVTITEGAPWGSLHAVLLSANVAGKPRTGDGEKVVERSSVERVYTMMVQGTVFGQIEATSSSLNRPRVTSSVVSVGQLAPGAGFQGTIRLENRMGKPFVLSEAVVQPGDITDVRTTITAATATSYDILIAGNANGQPGPFTGKIVARTDVPGEEELTLYFLGSINRPGAAAARR